MQQKHSMPYFDLKEKTKTNVSLKSVLVVLKNKQKVDGYIGYPRDWLGMVV